MGLVGTFGSFTIARLGIFASQAGLNITGNNIANINTGGYTRQNLDQISLRTGGSDRYSSIATAGSGNGVLSVGVSQTRDLYLDIRYRSEAASVGAYDAWLSGLDDIAAVLDEVGDGDDDGILEKQFSEFTKALSNLSYFTGQDEFEVQAREAANTLTNLFNEYARRLNTVMDNTEGRLEDDVETVNEILTNIRNLNSSIRKAELHNDKALELRDERNLLLDKLAQYVDIDVQYSKEDLGGNVFVEKLSVAIADTDIQLVDGVFCRQFECGDLEDETLSYDDKDYLMSLTELVNQRGIVHSTRVPDGQGGYDVVESQPVNLGDNDLHGAIQSTRELLTEKGEFSTDDEIKADPDASTKRGIPYYQKALDLLANKFAAVFNEANSQIMQAEDGITGVKTVMLPELEINGTTYRFDPPVECYEITGNCNLEETAYGDLALVKDINGLLANSTEVANLIGTFSDPRVSGTTEEEIVNSLKELQWEHLVEMEHYVAEPNNLFSNGGDSDDDSDITAANISVSQSWANGDVEIIGSYTSDGSTANDNILHMVYLMDEDHVFNPRDVFQFADCDNLFTGSFQEMLSSVSATLGNDQNSTMTMLDADYTRAVELDANRDNVSSVDLNDEAANLMQYQNSYAAACKLLTTLDEVLNTLINAT